MRAGPPSRRGVRRLLERRSVVLAVLVLAGLLLLAGSLPWAGGEVRTVLGTRDVSVAGSTAAPGVGAAALVVAAAALAVALGRRVGAAVAGVVLVGAAVLVAASTIGFLTDPEAPVRSAAAELSGVPELAGPASTTPWPALALVLAAALAVLGAVTLVAGRHWQATGRRFERETPAPSVRSAAGRATVDRTRAMDDWDALGRGEDPSQGERPAEPPVPGARPAEPPVPGGRPAEPPAPGAT